MSPSGKRVYCFKKRTLGNYSNAGSFAILKFDPTCHLLPPSLLRTIFLCFDWSSNFPSANHHEALCQKTRCADLGQLFKTKMSKQDPAKMQLKDVLFFFTLLSSIPFGYVVKQINSPVQKRLICTVAGVVTVLLLNGIFDFLHSLITILGTYCICKSSRYCNRI